jgi:hypothetical protein
MMKTLKEKEQKRLIKKAHTLYRRLGMHEEARRAFLSAWGVEHTNELTTEQLLEACNKLDMLLNPEAAELDKWRKRLMASIGSWLRSTGGEESSLYIKAIACRAAGKERFNDIPLSSLRNLYYEFVNKRKAHEVVNVIDGERALSVISLN